ncbi:MAG TPA: uroporphyrinogen-III C-methyltransferase [Sediminibacterium sp.]|nr:uroporphyrinogen-III C-methyltransferase [Sediminibacterium sp.]
MANTEKKGKVILAGAGPGDPELITLKAVNWLQQADVVLTDRLVSKVILQRYIRPQALLMQVGKQCRRGVSTPQHEINALMVRYAAAGKLVVRLKGGDISFFSNVLDELETLHEHHIPYEIVPGVTAASGAAAYAGFPLTARDHAMGVRFLTYYQSSAITAAQWTELAATSDTLVFYMSSETLYALIEHLLAHGIPADMPVAVLEQATTTYQQVYRSTIQDCRSEWDGLTFLSPSLVVIGRVAALHDRYAWKEGSSLRQYYFQPLTSPVTNLHYQDTDQQYAGRA